MSDLDCIEADQSKIILGHCIFVYHWFKVAHCKIHSH